MRIRHEGWTRGKAVFAAGAVFLLLAAAASHDAVAGQVVTKDTREWAAAALRQEKAAGAAVGRNTLAVLYFGNRTGSPDNDPLRKGMAVMLTTDLSSVKGLQVVERIRIQALQEELGLGVSGLVEPGTEPRVGRILGAQWIVGGDLSGGVPAPLKADSRVLDVPKTDIVGQAGASGDVAELFRIEKDLLFGIISALKIEVTPEEEKRLRKPCSTKTAALFALFGAVEESDRGNYDKAAEEYEKALKEDPGVCLAADGLAELRQLGLLGAGKKRTVETLRTLRGETTLTDQLAPKDQIREALPPGSLPTPANVNVIFP